MGDSLSAVDLGVGVTAMAVTAGYVHTCALLSTGAVKCWGDNGSGQLGVGDTTARGDGAGEMGDALPAVDLGAGLSATAIAGGFVHTCALLSSGAVKCWGGNSTGQLGVGDATARGDGAGEMGGDLPSVDLGSGAIATAISAGLFHSCALLSTGAVKCWGYNEVGQLGVGDTDYRGDGAGEMGDLLPVVNIGSGVTALSVSVKHNHSCVLLSSGAVKCWGSNLRGQLGVGDTDDRGDSAGEMGGLLPVVDLGSGAIATAISVGEYYSCALLSSGAVKCWGYNSDGQLGVGDTTARGDGAGEMGDSLSAVDLGVGVTAMAVTAGYVHTCALLSTGAVKCWGNNRDGQLGQSSRLLYGGFSEMGDLLPVSYRFVDQLMSQLVVPGVPGRPTGVGGDGLATVSVVAPPIGATVVSYTVKAVGNEVLTCLVKVPATSCVVAGLTNERAYTFVSSATNAAGTSEASEASLAVTPRGAVIAAPAVVTTNVPTTSTTTVVAPSVSMLKVITALRRSKLSESPMFAGATIVATHKGFVPGEKVQLFVASTPRLIGTGIANRSGLVTITGKIPSNLGIGKHTLALYAPVSGIGFRQTINVGAGTLPATGTNTEGPFVSALLMLVLGSMFLLWTRRRSVAVPQAMTSIDG
jgi:LPXTG-motif cell wall-anchored protein